MNYINKNIQYSILTLLLVFILCGCCNDVKGFTNTTVEIDESTTQNSSLVSADSTTINASMEDDAQPAPPKYIVKNVGQLSIQDSENAYEMCIRALTDYYKAIWNGSDSNLDTFIQNEDLKQYIQYKIQHQSNLYVPFKYFVESVHIGSRGAEPEVTYTDDADGGFLYLKLPGEIKQTLGSYGEVSEFLVRNVNDQLVIVDWYTGGKDTYDFIVRGENETIDNPNFWTDSEWVRKLNNRQIQFSGSTRP